MSERNHRSPIEKVLKKLARETAEKIFSEIESEVIESYKAGGGALESLFLIDRASDLKTFCDGIKITQHEFANFIMSCEARLVPWLHRISHRQFVPDHLALTESDRSDMSKAKPGDQLPKGFRKIISTFRERRMLVGHIFYHDDPSLWHFFYFDQRDISANHNHWREGAHLHFINWLTRPKQTANDIWVEFHDGNPDMKGALHIRCAFDR
jgi:hypothetical protein